MSWIVELSDRGDEVHFETFEQAIDYAWRYAPEFDIRPMVFRDSARADGRLRTWS